MQVRVQVVLGYVSVEPWDPARRVFPLHGLSESDRSDTWQLEQQNDQPEAGGFLVSTPANKKKEYSDVVQTKNYPRLGNQSIFKFKF